MRKEKKVRHVATLTSRPGFDKIPPVVMSRIMDEKMFSAAIGRIFFARRDVRLSPVFATMEV